MPLKLKYLNLFLFMPQNLHKLLCCYIITEKFWVTSHMFWRLTALDGWLNRNVSFWNIKIITPVWKMGVGGQTLSNSAYFNLLNFTLLFLGIWDSTFYFSFKMYPFYLTVIYFTVTLGHGWKNFLYSGPNTFKQKVKYLGLFLDQVITVV